MKYYSFIITRNKKKNKHSISLDQRENLYIRIKLWHIKIFNK